jgi:translation initiation factor 3 subunit D
VDIRPEWAVKEQIPFTSLAKLSCSVGEPEDLHQAGSLEYYDRAYDKLSARQDRPLERTKRAFRNVTTSDDPVIRQLAADGKAKVCVWGGGDWEPAGGGVGAGMRAGGFGAC